MKLRALPWITCALVPFLARPTLACTMEMVESTMLSWTRDDGALYFDSYDALYRLDPTTGHVEAVPLGSNPKALTSTFSISPDRRTLALATASYDASCRGLEPRLSLIDLETRKTLAETGRRRGYLGVLGWATDSRSLIVGFSDRRTSAMDSPPFQQATRVGHDLQPIESLPPEAFGHLRPDLRMALAFDRPSVLSAHWLDDPRRSRGLVAVDLEQSSLRFSADGRLVGYGLPRSAKESVIVIRDAESLARIALLPLAGQHVVGLAFHPSRPLVAVASEEIPNPTHPNPFPDTRLDLIDFRAAETLGRVSVAGYRAAHLEWSHVGSTLAVDGSLDESSGRRRPWLIGLDQLAPGS